MNSSRPPWLLLGLSIARKLLHMQRGPAQSWTSLQEAARQARPWRAVSSSVPATSYLRVDKGEWSLSVSLPSLQMPQPLLALVAVCLGGLAAWHFASSGDTAHVAAMLLACFVFHLGLPFYAPLRVTLDRDHWHVLHRRSLWDALSPFTRASVGRTSDIVCAQVRPAQRSTLFHLLGGSSAVHLTRAPLQVVHKHRGRAPRTPALTLVVRGHSPAGDEALTEKVVYTPLRCVAPLSTSEMEFLAVSINDFLEANVQPVADAVVEEDALHVYSPQHGGDKRARPPSSRGEFVEMHTRFAALRRGERVDGGTLRGGPSVEELSTSLHPFATPTTAEQPPGGAQPLPRFCTRFDDTLIVELSRPGRRSYCASSVAAAALGLYAGVRVWQACVALWTRPQDTFGRQGMLVIGCVMAVVWLARVAHQFAILAMVRDELCISQSEWCLSQVQQTSGHWPFWLSLWPSPFAEAQLGCKDELEGVKARLIDSGTACLLRRTPCALLARPLAAPQVTSAAVRAPPDLPFWTAEPGVDVGVATGTLTLVYWDGMQQPLRMGRCLPVETLQSMARAVNDALGSSHPPSDEARLSLLADFDTAAACDDDEEDTLEERQASFLDQLAGASIGARATLYGLPPVLSSRVRVRRSKGILRIDIAPTAARKDAGKACAIAATLSFAFVAACMLVRHLFAYNRAMWMRRGGTTERLDIQRFWAGTLWWAAASVTSQFLLLACCLGRPRPRTAKLKLDRVRGTWSVATLQIDLFGLEGWGSRKDFAGRLEDLKGCKVRTVPAAPLCSRRPQCAGQCVPSRVCRSAHGAFMSTLAHVSC